MKRLLLLLIPLLLAVPASAAELRLSVAASMTDVTNELNAAFRARHPEVELHANFGGSGALAKQIAAGAPADLFISANPQWMEYLLQQGRMAPATVRTLAFNTLVFIGSQERPVAGLDGLKGLARIALGSPRSVPAGRYAQQALTAAGLYAGLAADGRLVLAKDVRQALLYADRGEVDGAFVYATDAALARQAMVLFTVPSQLYPRVTYPVGLTAVGAAKPAARALLDFLGSDEAKTILRKYRFVVE